MSLLQCVQDIALNVGVDSPSSAVGGDTTSQQIVAFLQIAGDELARKYDWQKLKRSSTITGDGTTTVWAYPSDFLRNFNGEAYWSNKYPAVPLGGAVTDEEWLAITSLQVQPQRPVWRIYQGQFQTYPALASGEVVTTQYITKYWLTDSTGGTPKSRWSADTDVALIPETVLTLDGIWRWKRAKGLDYAEEFRTAQNAIERAAGQDNGPRTVYTSRGLGTNILGTNPFNPIVVVQ